MTDETEDILEARHGLRSKPCRISITEAPLPIATLKSIALSLSEKTTASSIGELDLADCGKRFRNWCVHTCVGATKRESEFRATLVAALGPDAITSSRNGFPVVYGLTWPRGERSYLP